MERLFTKEEIAKQRELDKVAKEKEWEALAKEAGGGERGAGIADAFKQLYTLYTPALAEWFAKLYDPEVGGYYSTTSGHDTEGFGPDVEVTVQSLRFIESSGMLREVGTLLEALPEGMQEAMLKFAKRLQHPNGYFYHPQWTFNDVHYNLSRRGRDLGWATSLISTMGGTPTYDTPNGRKGDGLDADGNPVAAAGCCEEKAADDNAPAAAKNYPEYLEDKESFENYLSTVKIRENSYWWGNQFNATYTQIDARAKALIDGGADYDLRDILINWLNERIDPNTGYWGEFTNLAGTNGFFKIITLYNFWKKPYPMPEKVTESVLKGIMGDEIAKGNCCSIYNLWSAICSIKANVKNCHPEDVRERVLHTIDETLRDNGREAILITYKKMAPYQKNGCEFSHSYESCGGGQQGLPTGLNPTYGVLEGNVDATCICSSGLTRGMFDAFGFKKVSLLMKADWMNYKNILMSYGPAKKIRVQDPIVNFDDGKIPLAVRSMGGAELSVSDGKLTVCAEGEGKGIDLLPTARICKGDVFLFEADVTVPSISGEGILRFENRTGALERIEDVTFFDMKIQDGKVSFFSDKWEAGFSVKDAANADGFKLRVELDLVDAPRADGAKRLCSAMHVYADGKFIGSIINNASDPKCPSGYTLGTTSRVCFGTGEGTEAHFTIDNLRHSYANK
ncbi:MAG: hypothetical protein IJE25_05960 [Clostridia bacterium]|nr:hypothetical protein [Clostridia bacterium]